MKLAILLPIVAILAVACSEQPNTIDLTPSNNGQALDVTTNQFLNIKLDSNITTGYKWSLVGEPDAQVMKFVSSDYQAPTGGGLGAGGTETWIFQTVGRGTTSLKLAYFRPFEPNTPPAKEYSITVNVK